MILLASILAFFSFPAEAPGCRGCNAAPESEDDRDLLVFTSFSVPLESWKDLSAEMEKTGGVFVIRGMIPGESFEGVMLKVVELKAKGISAPIDIDPAAFEEYGCNAVPMVVLRDGKKWDKVTGNIPIHTALERMAESGDAKKKAAQLLEQWKQP